MLYRAAATVAVLAALLTTFDAPRNRAAASDDLVKVEIATLLMNEQDRNVLLVLKPAEGALAPEAAEARLVLPMVIGLEEARSILVAHYKISVPRPLTHDLMKQMVAEYGGEMVDCAITKMEREAFFAELRLKREGREFVMDCRPSDAIALSLRAGAPIYVRRRVLTEHGVDPTQPNRQRGTIKT